MVVRRVGAWAGEVALLLVLQPNSVGWALQAAVGASQLICRRMRVGYACWHRLSLLLRPSHPVYYLKCQMRQGFAWQRSALQSYSYITRRRQYDSSPTYLHYSSGCARR